MSVCVCALVREMRRERACVRVPQNICFDYSVPPSSALQEENQQFVANELSQCDPCKHLQAGKSSPGQKHVRSLSSSNS